MAITDFLRIVGELNYRDDVYVVGGTVRNWLLGYPITDDFDLAVKGDSHKLAELIAHITYGDVVNVGGEHNVTRVARNGEIIFDISGFDDTIEEDLTRRDFTVNALAVPLSSWAVDRKIIGDPSDAENQILRPVSPTIFEDDGARLLRAFRFSKQYDLYITSELKNMMIDDKHHLHDAAPERVMKEFLAILALNYAYGNMVGLDQIGLLTMVIPELEKCRDLRQPARWHQHDVFWHQLNALRFTEALMSENGYMGAGTFSDYFDQKVASNQTRRTLVKLATLTHDIGKQETQTIDIEKNDIHFYGHQEVGENIMRSRLSNLKMAGKNINMVCKLIRHHMRVHDILDSKASPRAIHRFFRALDSETLDMLILGLGDRRGHRAKFDETKWENYVNGFNRALTLFEKPVNQPPVGSSYVDGKYIMRTLGLEPGPRIGELLRAVTEAEALGEVTNEEEAYLFMERIVFPGDKDEEANKETVRDEASGETPTEG